MSKERGEGMGVVHGVGSWEERLDGVLWGRRGSGLSTERLVQGAGGGRGGGR